MARGTSLAHERRGCASSHLCGIKAYFALQCVGILSSSQYSLSLEHKHDIAMASNSVAMKVDEQLRDALESIQQIIANKGEKQRLLDAFVGTATQKRDSKERKDVLAEFDNQIRASGALIDVLEKVLLGLESNKENAAEITEMIMQQKARVEFLLIQESSHRCAITEKREVYDTTATYTLKGLIANASTNNTKKTARKNYNTAVAKDSSEVMDTLLKAADVDSDLGYAIKQSLSGMKAILEKRRAHLCDRHSNAKKARDAKKFWRGGLTKKQMMENVRENLEGTDLMMEGCILQSKNVTLTRSKGEWVYNEL